MLYLVALTVQPESGPLPAARVGGPDITVYEDARGVAVHLRKTADALIFSSTLPAGWTFNVIVDGDQDNKWGYGSGMPDPRKRTSPDKKFGQDARNGIFCSQYVYTTFEDDPKQIEFSSQCGGLPSKGRAILSGFDSPERSKIVLEIPADEIFGSLPTAHVQVCIWDTVRWSCQHELPNLMVLTR